MSSASAAQPTLAHALRPSGSNGGRAHQYPKYHQSPSPLPSLLSPHYNARITRSSPTSARTSDCDEDSPPLIDEEIVEESDSDIPCEHRRTQFRNTKSNHSRAHRKHHHRHHQQHSERVSESESDRASASDGSSHSQRTRSVRTTASSASIDISTSAGISTAGDRSPSPKRAAIPASGSHASVSSMADGEDDDADGWEEPDSAVREKTSLLRSTLQSASNHRHVSHPLTSPPNTVKTLTIQLSPQLLGRSTSNGSASSNKTPRTSLSLHQSRVPLKTILGLSLYWLGWSQLWLPLLVVIIPTQARELAGEANKGSALGATLFLGSAVSAISAPILGSYSDSCTHSAGRRRPFMVVGCVLATVALVALAFAPNLQFFGLSFLLLSLANSAIISPFSALVPDLIPKSQRGQASGWLGFFSMLGNLFGGALSSFVSVLELPIIYFVLLTVHGLTMYWTCRSIDEQPLNLYELPTVASIAHHDTDSLVPTVKPPTGFRRLLSLIRPFLSHDFRVVFFVRFLFQLGCITVQENLLYYLHDEIGVLNIDDPRQRLFLVGDRVLATSSEQAVTLLFVPVLLGALLSSLLIGVLSDRIGKKKVMVYYSGGIMCFAGLLFAVTRSFAISLALGLIFGVGFGAFSTLEWLLCCEVLPNPIEFAKDMGIWSLALVIPQILAVPAAGAILDTAQHLNHPSLGYSAIFLVAAGYFTAGTMAVKYLESVD